MTEVKCGMKDNRKADIRRPMYDADFFWYEKDLFYRAFGLSGRRGPLS